MIKPGFTISAFKCTQEQMRIIWNEMALFNRLGELDTRIGKKNFSSRKGKTELNEFNTRMKFFLNFHTY